MAKSAEFHVRLAACTHNAAIEMLVHSFHGPLLMSLREAVDHVPADGPARHLRAPRPGRGDRRAGRDHRDRAMHRHLSRTARRLARASAF